MKYEVTSDSCAFGPGQRVRLSDAQIATRSHNLTVLDERTGEVEPTTQIVFKKGEVIELAEEPENLSSYFKSVLTRAPKEMVDAAKKAEAPSVKRQKHGSKSPAQPVSGEGSNAGAKAADVSKATDPDAGGNQNGAGNNAPNPAA